MSLDAIEMPARSEPVGTRSRHGLGKIDRRTARWRRIQAVIDGLRRQLGGEVQPSQMSLIHTAAALTLAIEDMTVAGRLDDPELVRATNSLRHILSALGLARPVLSSSGEVEASHAQLMSIFREAMGESEKPAGSVCGEVLSGTPPAGNRTSESPLPPSEWSPRGGGR